MKKDLKTLFEGVKQLYIVPSYLAREDPKLAILSPNDLKELLGPAVQSVTAPATLDQHLATAIKKHVKDGDIVLCLSAGGGNSLDEWLRKTFKAVK